MDLNGCFPASLRIGAGRFDCWFSVSTRLFFTCDVASERLSFRIEQSCPDSLGLTIDITGSRLAASRAYLRVKCCSAVRWGPTQLPRSERWADDAGPDENRSPSYARRK